MGICVDRLALASSLRLYWQRVGGELPFTYLFNRGPQAPLRCRRGPFPGTYMIRYAGYAG